MQQFKAISDDSRSDVKCLLSISVVTKFHVCAVLRPFVGGNATAQARNIFVAMPGRNDALWLKKLLQINIPIA